MLLIKGCDQSLENKIFIVVKDAVDIYRTLAI